MKSFALLAVAAVIALPARACLNDRDSDSLAVQAAQLPETLRVITGRFERNPPLYYQMRIERERAALAATPKQFGLYDDIGVALDKLGRSDEALETMKAKRAVLPAFNPKDKANKEAWYRTFANEGTFRAHRYLKNWGSYDSLRDRDTDKIPAELSELKNARDQIKRAIEIKPDAHFGRERYQLMAMDWIIARQSGATKKMLGQWIRGRDGWQEVFGASMVENRGHNRAVEGLSGLIVLGGAWESPDVFDALGEALNTKDSVTLRYIALLRARELLKNGKSSLGGLNEIYQNSLPSYSPLEDIGIGINAKNGKQLQVLFVRLRSEADAWNDARQTWMTKKLESGNHPDTNANFWRGYVASEPPSLEIDWRNQRKQTAKFITGWLTAAVLIVTGIPLALIALWVWRRRSLKLRQI